MAEVDDWAAESEPRAEEPVEVIPEKTWVDIKLFNKWSTEDVQVPDMSLQDYIAVKEKYAKYLPHSAGRLVSEQGSQVHPAMHISWEFNLTMVKYLEPMCNRNS